MPAVSVDTFFACSLMVLLVLTAMATTSKVLYPHIENGAGNDVSLKAMEISRYLLLTAGYPADWGQHGQMVPDSLGFASADDDLAYGLDVDKVSRLNSESRFSLGYAEMFSALGMPDVSFRISLKPLFDVTAELAHIYPLTDETVYEFDVLIDKNGLTVAGELVWYVVAGEYLGSGTAPALDGQVSFNVTLQNALQGPGLLVVFVRSCYDDRMGSFSFQRFAHGLVLPEPDGTFLRLSPLNNTLDAYFLAENLSVLDVYALTFGHNFSLIISGGSGQSMTYQIPGLADSGPIVLVATGRNGSRFFAEWAAYPQVPVVAGADLAGATGLADVSACQCVVSVRGGLYECTVWVGGLRE